MRHLAALMAVQLLTIPGYTAEKSRSPDGSKTYKCGEEKQSAMGCFNYWVRSYSPDLPKADRTNDGVWLPASCKGQAPYYLCHQGGVAWWYWSHGAIGSQVLKGFTARDYSVPGNEQKLGTAKLLKGEKGCYGVAGRTYCMIPMVER